MRAVVHKAPYQMQVEDVPEPRTEGPNDVIIQVTSTAICGSDLHIYRGRTARQTGRVFGHEPMGMVVETGPGVTQIKRGDRVVVPFNVACGMCDNCVRGYTYACLTVNPSTVHAAYGYVNMGRFRAPRPSTCASPTATSSALSSPAPRATSGRTTSSCWPTSFPPATTRRSSPRSAPARPSPSGAPGRSA